MLRTVALVPQVLAAALIFYGLVTAAAGWRTPRPPERGDRTRRFMVVVPAHNEEAVIEGVVADLVRQDYPAGEVWVLADRCTDRTAELARTGGARVMERDGGAPGKGALLGWFLDLRPLGPDDCLLVVDADNRLAPDTLSLLADELDAGHEVVQVYLDVLNPDESPLTLASALSYWAGNRMVQLARSNLGWSADLGGTGMAFTGRALSAVGSFGGSATEDNEMALRLALAAIPVHWSHHIKVYDEKPSAAGVAIRQRARWKSGKGGLRKRYLGRLARAAFTRRSWGLMDQALRLVNPGRSLLALVSALLVAPAVMAPRYFLPWSLWAVLAAIQFFVPVAFLARDRVPARFLLRYPLLVILPLLAVPIALAARRARGWYHTPHGRGVSDRGNAIEQPDPESDSI